MGLPAIEAYAMPTGSELPRDGVAWAIEPNRCALLIHDMQEYFLAPFVGSEPLASLLRNVGTIRHRCASRSIPIFYSVQPNGQSAAERGLLWDFWGPGMPAAQAASEIVSALMPNHDDTTIVKRRYSAFHRTELLAALRSRGRDQLIICGVYAHIGCLATAVDAFTNGVQPFIVADAVADFSAMHHRTALQHAARVCASVRSTCEVEEALADATRYGRVRAPARRVRNGAVS